MHGQGNNTIVPYWGIAIENGVMKHGRKIPEENVGIDVKGKTMELKHIWLVVWNMNYIFFHILGGIVTPTDELIFFRGVETTNQHMLTHIFPSKSWYIGTWLTTRGTHFQHLNEKSPGLPVKCHWNSPFHPQLKPVSEVIKSHQESSSNPFPIPSPYSKHPLHFSHAGCAESFESQQPLETTKRGPFGDGFFLQPWDLVLGDTRPGKRLQKTMERSTMLLMGKYPLFRLGHFQ